MKIEIKQYSTDYKNLMYLAGRSCFGMEDIKDETSDLQKSNFIKKIIKLDHGTVLEHCVYSFFIKDVSRSLMAQITRHRHISFNIKSQHYLVHKKFTYKPMEFVEDKVAVKLYDDLMERIEHVYSKLIDDHKIPHYIAREVLPNATYTNIFMTLNARSLRHLLLLRLPNTNTPEIIQLSKELLKTVYVYTPEIVEDLYEKYINNDTKHLVG